jgi:hypothetical protein
METECHPAKNTSFAENGYDIPVFGVGHSCFYEILNDSKEKTFVVMNVKNSIP